MKVSHLPAWKRRPYMIFTLPFLALAIIVMCFGLAVCQIGRLFCSVWDKW